MKMQRLNLLSLIGFILILILTSCSTPKLSILSSQQNGWKHGNKKVELVKCENPRIDQIIEIATSDTKIIESTESKIIDVSISENTDNLIVDYQTTSTSQELVNNEKKYNSLTQGQLFDEPTDTILDDCEIIILKNGEEIKGKVIEIGTNEIKYKKCNFLTGPTYVIRKSDVYIVQYKNGYQEIIEASEPTKNEIIDKETIEKQSEEISEEYRKSNRLGNIFALISFFACIGALFVFALPLSIIATLAGMISLSKLKKIPKKFNAKAYAVIGIIVGIIEIFVLFLMLSKAS